MLIITRLNLRGKTLTFENIRKIHVEIHNLEATDLCSSTFSAEEVQQGLQCEVKVYCLNNLDGVERRRLKQESAKWKAKPRCLSSKVTRSRIFLVLLPVYIRQTLEPRLKSVKQPPRYSEAVPDISDLQEFPPLVAESTLAISHGHQNTVTFSTCLSQADGNGNKTYMSSANLAINDSLAMDERPALEAPVVRGAIVNSWVDQPLHRRKPDLPLISH